MFGSKLEFKGAVIGMILGDGCLPNGRKTTHLQMCHKAADKEYLMKKAEMLQYLTAVNVRDGVSKLNGKEYPNVSLNTLSHPFYNQLHAHMYYDGRKTVDEHVMKCLTPLGLALWYLDDGTLAGEQGFRNPYICSHNFNRVENEMMCRMVHKRFGITFRTINKNVGDKSYYWMRLRRKDREKFFEIISPFIPDCMKRKIDCSLYESDDKYRVEKEMICDSCGLTFNAMIRSEAKNCPKCHLDNLRVGHKSYYANESEKRKESCIQCGTEFIRRPGKNTQHCSKACAGISHSNMWKNKRGDQAIA
jgi:protein-arginine kinase activator protein McsA